MESCSLPSSTSYFAEIGLPSLALAVRPCWSGVLTPFSALASSARSLSSCGCAQLIGIAKHHATRNATADIVIFRMFLLSRFLIDGSATSFASTPCRDRRKLPSRARGGRHDPPCARRDRSSPGPRPRLRRGRPWHRDRPPHRG